ncbi:MAG TPA: 4-alpha-glucanotransferase [Chitinophagaceae bacterium]|nr:4-alpha-glucanotransferase [Chitinophagaceae bacterium]
MRIQFYLRYHTRFGESLWICGNTEELGDGDPARALPMRYLNEEFWEAALELKRKTLPKHLRYKYYLKDEQGELIAEWENDRELSGWGNLDELHAVDTWNHAGDFENAFYTAPFRNVLLKKRQKKLASATKSFTHVFRVKAPLLGENECLCLLGSNAVLNDWNTGNPIFLNRKGNWWTTRIDFSGEELPASYKYGVYDHAESKFLRYEEGNNRLLYAKGGRKKAVIVHDGFARLPNNNWKGAGVAIPVFSLRSRNGFGVGEFADIRLLVDWAREAGMKLIQLLPVNDTVATHSWLDSYPYAAISAFALHPLYINLHLVAGKQLAKTLTPLNHKQQELNDAPHVNYEDVMKLKTGVLKELYQVTGEECFGSEDYKDFFRENRHWLEPYAVFCFFRDRNGHSHFDDWETHQRFQPEEVEKLCSRKSPVFREVAFYFFIQYHLHRQLKDAADYAHRKGVVLKGDIPIGVYRYGCDAWMAPRLFHMDWQAGAPPDDFTAVGQNWGFPTYNWKEMQADRFSWWKQRFAQMSNYFDAFRIDHILGFFRIWSIPADEVQGIMGRFVPCLPVQASEFGERGIWFDQERYCKPYITPRVLDDVFGALAGKVRLQFLEPNGSGFQLLPGFRTQHQVQQHFARLESTPENESLRTGLLYLISNVILFEVENGNPGYHFRISMEKTHSFRDLDPPTREKLQALYVDYFFRRQDEFWKKEAMHKLPQLKASTNMLVCGEDLGMVPHCVPDVMQQLGILSLEIQRMPKDPKKEFFHPDDAPYLSVITPSTHDMSTIRGWWEENRERTQHFYNTVLGQWGDAPQFCEAWINRAVVLQHLYSPAMWSIFQVQDVLGMSETLRRQDPAEERINDPANPQHYWRYRMHIPLEDLILQKEFNEELKGYVLHSGR